MLQAGAQLRMPIPGTIDIVEQNSRIRRMARQMVKSMDNLSEVYVAAEVRDPRAAAAIPGAVLAERQ